jgi:hypothetical protein
MRYRKRNKAEHDGEEPKQNPDQYNQPNVEQEGHQEGEYHDEGNHNVQQPAQSWQPMKNFNFQGQEGAEGGADNKTKAMDLAKKGWAMYKDHKNKPQ